jgi:hypothetical protein
VKDVLVPVVVSLIAGLTGGGLLPLVQAARGRGKARVDAVDALSETAREWAAEFKQDATEARAELRQVRAEAHALAEELRALRLAILAPEASIDGLRELVRRGGDGGQNGPVNLYHS